MALTNGTRLGPYEILSALGAGGMGEVYRARDMRLDRTVAIKVLPAHLAADPQFRERFDREAHAIAGLNHPHICTLYDVGEAPGPRPSESIRFLVMEYLEGETIEARLQARATPAAAARGLIRGDGAGLPLAEALTIAIDIVDALDKAHRAGIVHRDLKPGNVMLTKAGAKLLDFGLAKARAPAVATAGGSMLPTTPVDLAHGRPITAQGTILGTFQYMAPEQLEGRNADARTDIFAFGAVVYEMVTGMNAFEGKSQASLIAAILDHEPPQMAATRPLTPPALDHIVTRCLAKDPDDRWQSTSDVTRELKWIIESSTTAAAATVSAAGSRRHRSQRAWPTAALICGLIIGAGAAMWINGRLARGRRPDTRPLRVSIVHSEGRDVGTPAISPDGARVAYGARRLDGMPVLWVRDLASGEARAFAGTEGAFLPFWSPDSRDVAFFARYGFLKRVAADGGPIQIVTDDGAGTGGTWAQDGTIVFGRGDLGLFRVRADGGAATPATKLQGKDWSHYWPSFLPDGRRFLFTAQLHTRTAEEGEQGIYLGSLDSPEIRRLLPDLSSAVYAPPGFLVFVRDGTLTAAPFDLATGRVIAPPAPIGGAVAGDSNYFSGVSAAADGTLAVRPPPAEALRGAGGGGSGISELHLVDRNGVGSRVGTAQLFSSRMALNPDGNRVAASILDPRTGSDLWLVDLQTGDKTPLATTHGFAGGPVWSPDGARLAYRYQRPGQMDDVYMRDLRTGQVMPVIESPAVSEGPVAWSHDGAHLLVFVFDEKGESSLSAWSFGSRTLTPFVATGGSVAAFSPDDRYVAYNDVESGRGEVFVTTFPERQQTWSLTTEGGRVLSWRADGREILVATKSGQIVAYPVSTEGGFSAGPPTVLVRDVGSAAELSTATRDHSKILIRVSPDAAKDKGEIRLLFGWVDAWRAGRPLTRP